ncbi:hypothetical protein GCM10027430_30590 [Lysobacter tyrosinilyticus]
MDLAALAMSRLTQCHGEAATAFLPAVRPIYARVDGIPECVATGFLLRLYGRSFLATAAHAADNDRRAPLMIGGKDALVDIDCFFECTPLPPNGRAHDRFDLAFCELTPKAVSKLGDVRFLGEDDLAAAPESADGHAYLALGYPVAMNSDVNIDPALRHARATMWHYSATPWENQALQEKLSVTASTHIFLKFSSLSRESDGTMIESIAPRGASGGVLIDLGKFLALSALKKGQCPRPRVAGLLIEHQASDSTIVSTKTHLLVDAIKRYVAGDIPFPNDEPQLEAAE